MPTIIIDRQIATNLAISKLPTEQQFQTWIEVVLKQQKKRGEITIRLVDEPESQQLNNQYRHKNYPTNVLSFPFDNRGVKLATPLLGDLVICAPVVLQEAIDQQKEPLAHWAHMIVHGTLHLLGYDHIVDKEAAVMENLEKHILKKLGVANPYEEV